MAGSEPPTFFISSQSAATPSRLSSPADFRLTSMDSLQQNAAAATEGSGNVTSLNAPELYRHPAAARAREASQNFASAATAVLSRLFLKWYEGTAAPLAIPSPPPFDDELFRALRSEQEERKAALASPEERRQGQSNLDFCKISENPSPQPTEDNSCGVLRNSGFLDILESTAASRSAPSSLRASNPLTDLFCSGCDGEGQNGVPKVPESGLHARGIVGEGLGESVCPPFGFLREEEELRFTSLRIEHQNLRRLVSELQAKLHGLLLSEVPLRLQLHLQFEANRLARLKSRSAPERCAVSSPEDQQVSFKLRTQTRSTPEDASLSRASPSSATQQESPKKHRLKQDVQQQLQETSFQEDLRGSLSDNALDPASAQEPPSSESCGTQVLASLEEERNSLGLLTNAHTQQRLEQEDATLSVSCTCQDIPTPNLRPECTDGEGVCADDPSSSSAALDASSSVPISWTWSNEKLSGGSAKRRRKGSQGSCLSGGDQRAPGRKSSRPCQVCSNCAARQTPQWRYVNGASVCNACYMRRRKQLRTSSTMATHADASNRLFEGGSECLFRLHGTQHFFGKPKDAGRRSNTSTSRDSSGDRAEGGVQTDSQECLLNSAEIMRRRIRNEQEELQTHLEIQRKQQRLSHTLDNIDDPVPL